MYTNTDHNVILVQALAEPNSTKLKKKMMIFYFVHQHKLHIHTSALIINKILLLISATNREHISRRMKFRSIITLAAVIRDLTTKATTQLFCALAAEYLKG